MKLFVRVTRNPERPPWLTENDAIEDTPCAHFHKEFEQYSRAQNSFLPAATQANGNEEAVRRVYEDKNNEIIDYFKDRPDDFMILDLEKGDGWFELVNFLGKDFLKPFPHANKMRTGWKSKTLRRLRKKIARLALIVIIAILLIAWAYS